MTARRIIFWDFHGTLGARLGGWSGAIADVIAGRFPKLGVACQDIGQYLQTGFPWHTPSVPHPELSSPDRWWQALYPVLGCALVRLGVPSGSVDDMVLEVRSRYTDSSGWALYEDTIPVLRQLDDLCWRQIVVSNHVPELPEILCALGLGVLDMVITSARVGFEKPHEGIFRYALDRVGGHIRPRDAIWMVGDSMPADIAGAAAVGIPGILVRHWHPAARYYLATLAQVPEFL